MNISHCKRFRSSTLRLRFLPPPWSLYFSQLLLLARWELRRGKTPLAYRPRAMEEKASAGFSLYGRSEEASRLRRVLDEHEITAGIRTL